GARGTEGGAGTQLRNEAGAADRPRHGRGGRGHGGATGDRRRGQRRRAAGAGCAAGRILVGEETLRLCRHAVEAEPLEPLALKGKSERISAYRLIAVAAGSDSVRWRLEAPMVGRERQRRLLADAWERVCLERSCQLFTLL